MTSALLPAGEIADALGVTRRTVRRKAAAGEIGRPEPGRYDLATLSAEAALEWAEQQRGKVIEIGGNPGQMALELTAPVGPNLSEADRAEAKRRYEIIEPLVAPDRHQALWIEHRGRRLELLAWLSKQHQVGERTLYHWLKRYKASGIAGLVKKDRADKGQPRALNAPALDYLLAAMFPKKGAYGELSVAEFYRAYKEERAWREAHIGRAMDDFNARKYGRYLDDEGRLSASGRLPEASYETFRMWFKRIPEVARVMAREGVEAYANSQEIITARDLTPLKPLEYVVMDHRRLDLFCLMPDGRGWKLGRPWLTAAIDMRTRKWLAWAIVETPSSESIATVLKKTFLAHGLPQFLYWDNGKDFTCEYFEGRKTRAEEKPAVKDLAPEWRGVLESLGVRVTHAIVRRARAKIIEPNFTRTAQYDKSTPWWCGHKPTARPERFELLMQQHERWERGELGEPAFPTIAQIAALYGELLETLNEREMERAEGMRKVTPTGIGWMCPNEAWEKLIPQVARRTVDPAVMGFCFARRHTVKVQHGEIRTTLHGQKFHYRLLENPQALMMLNGYEIEFGYDPQDMETVAVYYRDRFMGLAGNAELRRMGEQAFVEDEKLRRASRREVKAAIAAAHRDVYIPDIAERAVRRSEVRPARIEPGRTVTAAAPPAAMIAAAEAAAKANRFSFAEADAASIEAQAPAPEDEGEFDFFGTGGNQ